MSATIPNVQEIGAEAEFQLLCAADQLNWLTALASAINIDHLHNKGKFANYLTEIARHFFDTNFSGVHTAIEEFRQLSESAPQNADIPDRGAELSGSTMAERLLTAREHASLSQVELAKLVGVSQAAVSGIESGESKRSSYLPELARACGVDVNWLAFGSEVSQ